MFYLILAGISFGTIGLFVNLIGDNISTLLIVSIRLLSTATLIYLYQVIKGTRKKIRLNSRREIYTVIIGGVIGFATTFSLYLKSLLLIPVSEAVFLHYLAFPFTTILYSYLFLNEEVTYYEIISLLGTIAGVFLIYNVGFSRGLTSIIGYSIAFVSGITYTAALLVLKNLGENRTTLQTLFWPAFVGGTGLLPVALLGGFTFKPGDGTLPPLLGLVLVSTLLGYSLFARGLKETRAGLSSVILITVEPLSAALMAVFFLGERLNPPTVMGGGLVIISGLFLYIGDIRTKRRTKEAG